MHNYQGQVGQQDLQWFVLFLFTILIMDQELEGPPPGGATGRETGKAPPNSPITAASETGTGTM